MHPTPGEPEHRAPSEGFVDTNGFIVNRNFRKEQTFSEPEEPEPIHYARREVQPPVRYVQEGAPPVHYTRAERQQPAPYVRPEQRMSPPVRKGRHKGRFVLETKDPKPFYVVRRPGQAPLVLVRRRRANRYMAMWL